MIVGTIAALEQTQGGDAATEVTLENRLTRRVRRIGDHREASPGDRAGDHHVLHGVGEARYQGAQVGDRGVVVEGGEHRCRQHQRGFGQAPEHRFDPPALDASVRDEAGQEEAHEQGRLEVDPVLVVFGDGGEPEEEEESPDEERRMVGIDDGPSHEQDVDERDPLRHRVLALIPRWILERRALVAREQVRELPLESVELDLVEALPERLGGELGIDVAVLDALQVVLLQPLTDSAGELLDHRGELLRQPSLGTDLRPDLVDAAFDGLPHQVGRQDLFLERPDRELVTQRSQLAPEKPPVESVADDDSKCGLPAELRQHVPMPQPQGPATISTGGAAKWVRVPPTEMLTNKRPRVPYLNLLLGSRA